MFVRRDERVLRMNLHGALLRDGDEDEHIARRQRSAAAGTSSAPVARRHDDEDDGVAAIFEADEDEDEYVPVKKRRLQEAEDRYRRLGRTAAAPAREHDVVMPEQQPQQQARFVAGSCRYLCFPTGTRSR